MFGRSVGRDVNLTSVSERFPLIILSKMIGNLILVQMMQSMNDKFIIIGSRIFLFSQKHRFELHLQATHM